VSSALHVSEHGKQNHRADELCGREFLVQPDPCQCGAEQWFERDVDRADCRSDPCRPPGEEQKRDESSDDSQGSRAEKQIRPLG